MAARRTRQLAIAALLAAASIAAPSWAGDTRTRFVLESGAVIWGDVVAADAEALTIESPSLGRVRVPRDSVQEVREPASERIRHASAHERLAPTSREESETLEIRAQAGDDSIALLDRVLSIRLTEPLPASLAE